MRRGLLAYLELCRCVFSPKCGIRVTVAFGSYVVRTGGTKIVVLFRHALRMGGVPVRHPECWNFPRCAVCSGPAKEEIISKLKEFHPRKAADRGPYREASLHREQTSKRANRRL